MEQRPPRLGVTTPPRTHNPCNRPLPSLRSDRVAGGLVPMNLVRKEVDRLGGYCRANGNCYGILKDQVCMRLHGGSSFPFGERRAPGLISSLVGRGSPGVSKSWRLAAHMQLCHSRAPGAWRTLSRILVLKTAPAQRTQVRAAAYRMIPPDADAKSRRQGNTYLAVMIAPKVPGGKPRQELATNFTSKDDLVEALVTSCYTPLWAGPNITTT
jgi:hypothetical protein